MKAFCKGGPLKKRNFLPPPTFYETQLESYFLNPKTQEALGKIGHFNRLKPKKPWSRFFFFLKSGKPALGRKNRNRKKEAFCTPLLKERKKENLDGGQKWEAKRKKKAFNLGKKNLFFPLKTLRQKFLFSQEKLPGGPFFRKKKISKKGIFPP